MILKSFKSFVLEICDSEGVADAFLRIYVILKDLRALTGDSGLEIGNTERSLGSLRSLGTTIPGRMVVLEICDSEGVADAFLQIYVILKELPATRGGDWRIETDNACPSLRSG